MRYAIPPVGIALLVLLAHPALAQNEAALRQAFEGKVVTVRIDMPATNKGVDVYPLDPMPVNFREVAERLKDNSTSLRIGYDTLTPGRTFASHFATCSFACAASPSAAYTNVIGSWKMSRSGPATRPRLRAPYAPFGPLCQVAPSRCSSSGSPSSKASRCPSIETSIAAFG